MAAEWSKEMDNAERVREAGMMGMMVHPTAFIIVDGDVVSRS